MKTINLVSPPIKEGYIFPIELEYLSNTRCYKPKRYYKRNNTMNKVELIRVLSQSSKNNHPDHPFHHTPYHFLPDSTV